MKNEISHQKDAIYRKIIDFGLLGLIIFTPLPAASVNEWSILIIQLAILFMLAAYLMMKEKPAINPHLSFVFRRVKYLIGGFFIFLFFQILPLPVFLVKILSPHSFTFQQKFSIDISSANKMSLSLSPSLTIQEGMELLSYILLGFLIIRTVTSRRQIQRIFLVLIAMGFFEALYGMFELYNKSPRILFYKKIFNLGSVTGTFVNQNHYAGYLEMIIPLAIGLIIARIDLYLLAERKMREKVIHFAEKGFLVNILTTVSVIVMSLAVVLSKSRSGTFLVFLTFVLFAEITAIYFGRASFRQRGIRRFLQITFLVFTIISLYIGIGATIERFTLDDVLHGGRPYFWKSVLKIILDFPLFGTGVGTFASVYPAYANITTYGLLAHAHNDYLEYLSELGLIGMSMLFGFILFLCVQSFLIWYRRRNAEVKGWTLGGVVALLIIGIHSLTDFNLHIPANMVLFTVILSLTLVSGTYRMEKEKRKITRSTSREKYRPNKIAQEIK